MSLLWLSDYPNFFICVASIYCSLSFSSKAKCCHPFSCSNHDWIPVCPLQRTCAGKFKMLMTISQKLFTTPAGEARREGMSADEQFVTGSEHVQITIPSQRWVNSPLARRISLCQQQCSCSFDGHAQSAPLLNSRWYCSLGIQPVEVSSSDLS